MHRTNSNILLKQLFLVLLVSFVSFQAFAQENDSIIVVQSKAGRLSGLIDIQDLVNEGNNFWERDFKGHWSGIEFGFNGFANPNYKMYPANDKDFLRNNLLL